MNTLLQSPASPASPILQESDHSFTTWDGIELFYRAWKPAQRATHALILFHRGHEHSGRWSQFVQSLQLQNTAVFAWDARGHGQSPGERGYARSFQSFVKDADAFIKHISTSSQIPLTEMAILAHSVGAVIATQWVHDYAPPIRALVLATPAFDVKLYVPFAIPALRTLSKIKPKSFITSYVRSKMLTHDPEQAAAYDADPLISKQIATNILLDLHDASRRLVDDAGAIDVPALILGAGSDWVVKNSTLHRFFNRLSSPRKQIHIFPGMGHSIFHEVARQEVADRISQFLAAEFQNPAPRSIDAVHQYTQREFEKLSKPRPLFSPKNLFFKSQRVSLATVCRLSEGVKIGWKTGFDSGESLDCVYRNQPQGVTPLGKLIDYVYLNAIGWRGIRIRRQNIDALLREAITQIHQSGSPVQILDIAAGPGRYVLELLKSLNNPAIHATLRDRSPTALEKGRALAATLGLQNVTFEIGDAFNTAQIASTTPRPNVAIVSGLYELFPDNTLIQASLAGLAQALQPGGYLLYTTQPWHPQIEMIARTLHNRDGQPWIMRRRTQREMDALVQSAGFEKQQMQIDQWGIFSVTLARKPQPPTPNP